MTDFRWYVVQSKPGQAERAAQKFQNQGFEVFCPTIKVERVRSGKRIEKIEPMFPGYVFIELSELTSNWRPIRSTAGWRASSPLVTSPPWYRMMWSRVCVTGCACRPSCIILNRNSQCELKKAHSAI